MVQFVTINKFQLFKVINDIYCLNNILKINVTSVKIFFGKTKSN